MILKMEEIRERDIDLLIIRSFVENQNFRTFLLETVGLQGDCPVISAEHSQADEDGESDVTFIVKNRNEKVGILIEDKINAPAQPEQAYRYTKRGDSGITNNDYSSYCTLIVAPQDYLSVNQEAQKYNYQISYEQMREQFPENSFESQMITRALLKKQRAINEIHEIKEITTFWNDLYDYMDINFPRLALHGNRGDKKGIRHLWFYFFTPMKMATVVYKSERYLVDLELAGLSEQINAFRSANKAVLDRYPDLKLRPAGKSLAVYVQMDERPDCRSSFESQKDIMQTALEKVQFLKEEILPLLDLDID